MRVDGSVASGYEVVVDALAGCGSGVAVAAFVDGRRVVDVWTGDLFGDSLVCTWSAIKPVAGACLLLLVDRGRIGFDDPVVSTWPELGDDRLLIRHLLTHTAGRVTVPDVPLVDWDRSVAARGRDWWAAARGRPGSVRHRALGPWVDVNDRTWRQAEVPAVNGHATARGLAAFWQAFLDGQLPAGVGQPAVAGHDRFIDDEVTWTLAGGHVDGPDVGIGGLGGQWAAARPSAGLAWAFLTTRVGDHSRAQQVEDALLDAARTTG